MEKAILLKMIETAKRDVADAETDLARLLREIQIAPRADKTTISKVVEDAFSKLRSVKTNLLDLEGVVKSDDP
jgi:hypothetical protein